MTVPRVTAVIPTIGRAELKRAVSSARAQQGDVEVEIVVVVDAPAGTVELSRSVQMQADQVLWTGGSMGGSGARNLGVAAANGDFVAFLDDDDEWVSDKLTEQLRLIDSHQGRVVVSSRHIHREAATGRCSAAMPNRTIGEGQPVAEYLFRKRRPAGGRASLYTSSLLCRRELAIEIPWDASLRRHQDWDWLVNLNLRGGAAVVQSERALVFIQTGSTSSISAGTDWNSSLSWAKRALAGDPRTFADFVAGQTLRYAISARSFRGVSACIRELVRNRRLPSAGPSLIALGGLLPRIWIERLMTRVR